MKTPMLRQSIGHEPPNFGLRLQYILRIQSVNRYYSFCDLLHFDERFGSNTMLRTVGESSVGASRTTAFFVLKCLTATPQPPTPHLDLLPWSHNSP
jgi:hypothetical protein